MHLSLLSLLSDLSLFIFRDVGQSSGRYPQHLPGQQADQALVPGSGELDFGFRPQVCESLAISQDKPLPILASVGLPIR